MKEFKAFFSDFDFNAGLQNPILQIAILVIAFLFFLQFIFFLWGFYALLKPPKPKPYIGREKQVETFISYLTKTTDHIWSLYGEGGIGKSYLLNNFRDVCRQQKIACIKHDWEDYQSKIDASDYWLDATMLSGQKARYHFVWNPRQQPQSFSALAFYLGKSIEEQNQTIGFFKKILTLPLKKTALYLLVLPVLVFSRVLRLCGKHPEQALLYSLRSYLRKNHIVYLIDNHELSKVEITSRVKLSDNQLTMVAPYDLPLLNYLENIVIPFLNDEDNAFILVMTARRPLRLMNSVINNEVLKGLIIGDVKKLIQEDNPMDYEHILSLTQGNPLLINYCLILIENSSEAELDELFKKQDGQGFHHYVIERLAVRVMSIADAGTQLWRLAVPYRLPDDEVLEKLLFKQVGVFEAFEDLGLLKKIDHKHGIYSLHSTSKAALMAVAQDYKHQKAYEELHQALTNFFSESDSHNYHQLCATGRQRLEKYGLTPEEYWYLLVSRFDIGSEERHDWRLKPLPESEEILGLRIERLQAGGDLLAQLCGDGELFLQDKILSGLYQVTDLQQLDKLAVLLKEAPHLSDLHYLRGCALGNGSQAVAAFEQAIRLNSNHAWAYYRRALIHLQKQRLQAVEDLQQAVNLGLSGWHSHYALAQLEWLKGHHLKAGDEFKLILNKPVAMSALAMLEVWMSKNEIIESVATTETEVAKTIEIPMVEQSQDELNSEDDWFEQGKKYHDLKQYQQAVESYDKALAIKSDDYLIWYNQGLALEDLKEYQHALESYDKAISIKQDNDNIWHSRGHVLKNLGEYGKALDSYDKALELKDDCNVWRCRGVLLEEQKDYQQALESYDNALAINPNYDLFWFGRGVVLAHLKKYQQALDSYNKVLSLMPDDYRA